MQYKVRSQKGYLEGKNAESRYNHNTLLQINPHLGPLLFSAAAVFPVDVAGAVGAVVSAAAVAAALDSRLAGGDTPRGLVLIPKRSPSRAVNRLRLLVSSSSEALVARRCSCTRRSAAIRSWGLASSIRRGFRISQKPLTRREERLLGASSDASPDSRGGGKTVESGERLSLAVSAFCDIPGRRSMRLLGDTCQ